MKVLKIIIGIVVALVLLVLAYFMTLDSTYKVERSIDINAPSSLVMAHINSFTEWENWSPWKAKDTEAKYTYTGPESGVGSEMSWVTSYPEDSMWTDNYIGEGSMKLVSQNGDETVTYSLTFIKPWESSSTGGFELSEENGITTVKWYDTGELPFFQRPMGAMMDQMVGPDFEDGLARLKAHVEEHVSMATPSFNIEETTVESFPYISIIDSIAVESIGETLQGMYQKLGEFMAQNQLEQAGPNFAMYHTWDGKTTKMQGGVPLSEEVKGYENIVAGMSYSGNVLKLVFKGPYDDSEAAHEAIAAYAEENGKEIIGGPWEVYVVGYAQSQNPDEFVTEIYYPIN